MRFPENFDDNEENLTEELDLSDDDFETGTKPKTKTARKRQDRQKYRQIDDVLEEKRLRKEINDYDDFSLRNALYDDLNSKK